MRLDRQLGELGPTGHRPAKIRAAADTLNLVPGVRLGASGKAAGELGPCQEAWSCPTAAAGHPLTGHAFLWIPM